ncbi:MAG: hypothetical protein AAGA08_07875 [Pseudomonadota bacterium]
MSLTKQFRSSALICSPPPGAVNVSIGKPIDGPGGRWVPCACALADGAFVSCLYEVGAGRRQVCAANTTTYCVEEALSQAIELAEMAAA